VRRAGRTVRNLAYVLAALPFGAAGAAVLFAGWLLSALLSITPLVVPVLLGFRAAVGALARADAALAAALLGTDARPPLTSPPARGYWARLRSVLNDEDFWRQQVYLLQRLVAGWAMAIVVLTLLGGGLQAIAQPLLHPFTHPKIGSFEIDTLGRALLFVPAGILAVAVGLALVTPFGAVAQAAVTGLLGGAGSLGAAPLAHTRRVRLHWLALHAGAYAALAAGTTLIWLLTTRSYFWPEWPMLVFGVPLAIHAWVELVDLRPEVATRQRMTRGLAIHEGVSVVLAVFFTLIWAFTTRAYFWPVWPILALVLIFAAHAAVELWPSLRRGQLAERIESLEASRRGAVDQQDAELRRIERDLHDGAQARLVALGMSLGMAEQKLSTDPEAARELLDEARRGAQEALAELRDLARGIHPPVLADRGLEPAIAALAQRTPMHVRLTVDVDRRPAPPVESAAYFVVAEALANTGKHARAEHVDIVVRRRQATMVVEVVDDGVGGADRSGSGLAGLAKRVEALDGTLEVTSPAGGPTTVRAVMPCGS
jgi:signal transduction histidine kinase